MVYELQGTRWILVSHIPPSWSLCRPQRRSGCGFPKACEGHCRYATSSVILSWEIVFYVSVHPPLVCAQRDVRCFASRVQILVPRVFFPSNFECGVCSFLYLPMVHTEKRSQLLCGRHRMRYLRFSAFFIKNRSNPP